MALNEFDAATGDFMAGRNSESIQHSQQCAERVCKSILSYLGFILKKTHHPSDYIVEEILERPDIIQSSGLSEDDVRILVEIATLSSPLEKQGTMPRYGWETRDRIITPDEIYKKEISGIMFENARQLLIKSCDFYRLRELDGILENEVREVEEYVDKHRID
ncbi:MAG: HEPN domain-containing protein [Candidatus Methanoperedenaceae archaeon]|nr:HEPN domain-containing protein [Euryarchaeota archaeon]MCG2727817.1 HEPN domain-containing protein [Candidatus Methanoperedenaceae archaeon]